MRFAALFLAAATAWAIDCSVVPGWQQHGAARSYTAEDLFEYMDGNAEGYLIYGFVKMNGVTCKSGDDSILIDVSEMADPDSAYGIFTTNRDPARPVEQVGMSGQIAPRRAMFVKGNYFVELAANPEKDHSPALRQYVAALEKSIAGRTSLPDALGWFPQDKMTSIRLVPESVLGMRILKRGYVAQYETGKAFLVRESSPESAAGVMEKVKARLSGPEPANVADGAFQAADKYLGNICVFRKGAYVGGFAGDDAVNRAAALAAKVK